MGRSSGHAAISRRAMSTMPSKRSTAYSREYPRFSVRRNAACSAPSALSVERAAPNQALNPLQNSKERKCLVPCRARKRLASTPASTVKRRLSRRMP